MLKRILHSKRLLADHIEILEQCQIIPIDETNESFSTKPIIAGGCGLFTLAAISAKANLKWYILILCDTFDSIYFYRCNHVEQNSQI